MRSTEQFCTSRFPLQRYLGILQDFEGLLVSEFYSRSLVYFTNLKKKKEKKRVKYILIIYVSINSYPLIYLRSLKIHALTEQYLLRLLIFINLL